MIKSIFAVLAGFVAIVVTHIGTDQVMHSTGVFPPDGQAMFDPALNALALFYRCVFSVLGCALTAMLAPRAPMAHALVLGGIGTVLSGLGFYATMNMNLGPMWYPLALVVTALPCAWLGGVVGWGMKRLVCLLANFRANISLDCMAAFDEICLTPVEQLSAVQIRRIRAREKASQAVFARYLNVTTGLISQWERGEKHPSGAALTLVARKGLQAVA